MSKCHHVLEISGEKEADYDDPQNSESSCGWTEEPREQLGHQRDVAKVLRER